MRNLLQYPVTTTEIRDCLTEMAAEEAAYERIGDMRPTLLSLAAQIIDRLGFVTYGLADLPAPSIRRRVKRG